MTGTIASKMVAGLLLALALGGCGGTARAPVRAELPPPGASAATAPGATSRSHPRADAQFMADMIRHHAQAVLIAGWAPTHGASPAVRRLGERIVVGQHDEIALMERWLRDQGEPPPGPDSSHAMASDTTRAGMAQSTLMPGMLTAEQVAQLDHARGPEFDRLFLTFMIRHHAGALIMVERLFGTPGATQDATVFRLASDIHASQSAEIGRMQQLLAALAP